MTGLIITFSAIILGTLVGTWLGDEVTALVVIVGCGGIGLAVTWVELS